MTTRRRTKSAWLYRLLGLMLAFALVAAACGDDDDDGATGDDSADDADDSGNDADDSGNDADSADDADDGDDSGDDGDSADDADDGDDTTDTTPPEPTGEPIKIGSMELVMPIINLTQPREGAIRAAVRAINAAGGINGRPLEWVLCEAADPNEGEQCARDMVDEGVVATVADGNLFAELPSTTILNEAGIVQIHPFLQSAEASASPNVHLLGPTGPMMYAALAEATSRDGGASIYLLVAQTPTAQINYDAIDLGVAYSGIELVGSTEFALTAADFAPVVAAASGQADLTVAISSPDQLDLMLAAAEASAEDVRFGGTATQIDNERVATYGSGPLDGGLFVHFAPPVSAAGDFPEMQRFLDEMAAEFDNGTDAANSDDISAVAVESWLAVQAVAQVARGLDDVTAETVAAGFDSATDLDLGLIPLWTPSAEGPAGNEYVSNPFAYLMKVENGELVLFEDEPIDVTLPFQ